MQKTIHINGRELRYELEMKPVRNINLRIRADGSIHVSMSRRHTLQQVEELFRKNARGILNSLDRAEDLKANVSSIRLLSRLEEGRQTETTVRMLCGRYYPLFADVCGGCLPEIRFRRMHARWGSCAPKLKVLTFNTFLAYVPVRCVEYVVVHEFCHFLYANHSPQFYAAVAAILPDWKLRRDELRRYEGLMEQKGE